MNKFSFLSLLCMVSLAAAIPQLISLDGFLTDSSGSPLSGNYNFVFKLYTVSSGGTALWTETRNSLTVSSGNLNALLGSSTPLELPFDEDYYLEVEINGEVLSPRYRIAAASYAYHAKTADTADNLAPAANATGDLYVSGNLYAGVWQKIHEADLTSAADYTVSELDGESDIYYQILLSGYLTSGGADHILGIRPNGATVDYARGVQHVFERAGGTSFNHAASWWGTEAILPLGRNAWGADGSITMVGQMNAETGMARNIVSQWTYARAGTTDYTLGGNAQNSWLDTTTPITSLTIHFDGATDFDGKLIIFALR